MSDPDEKRGSLFYPAFETMNTNPPPHPAKDELDRWLADAEASRRACDEAHREMMRKALGPRPQADPVPPASPSSGE